MQKSDFV